MVRQGRFIFFVCAHDINRQRNYAENYHTKNIKLRPSPKSGLVGEAKSRSATAIKHDLVLKTSFSARTPFSGGKLTPFGVCEGAAAYVCIECTLVYSIIMENAEFVEP